MKIVDYRKLRFSNLKSRQFSHLFLLLFWIFYGWGFEFVETLSLNYTTIYHPLDDVVPFCEYFVIAYYFWFAYIVLAIIHTGLFDIPAFKRYMWFIILTYTFTLAFYLIFPNMQELRVTEFQNNNIFTEIVKYTYCIDTNTNVFPSLHVIGGVGSLFAFWEAKPFNTPSWRIANVICTILICLSTVFLKQHSVLDILGGLVVCAIAYPIVYKNKRLKTDYPYYLDTKESKKAAEREVAAVK